MWFGYKKEELLEAAHGDSHRFKKSSMPTLPIPVCSQGQSQIPHEGKPAADKTFQWGRYHQAWEEPLVDDSAQGYKVESNGNEAPCKESSCEGLHFQFTIKNREALISK